MAAHIKTHRVDFHRVWGIYKDTGNAKLQDCTDMAKAEKIKAKWLKTGKFSSVIVIDTHDHELTLWENGENITQEVKREVAMAKDNTSMDLVPA